VYILLYFTKLIESEPSLSFVNFEVKSRHACFDLRLTEDCVNLFERSCVWYQVKFIFLLRS